MDINLAASHYKNRLFYKKRRYFLQHWSKLGVRKEKGVESRSLYPVSKGEPLPLNGLTLPALLRSQAKRFGSKALIEFNGKTLSYEELNDKTDRLAKAFQDLGIRKGDRVAIMSQNCLEVVESYFAVWKTGAWTVPVNPMFTPHEVEYILRDAGTRMIVAGEAQYPRIVPVRKGVGPLETVVLFAFKTPAHTVSYDSLTKTSHGLEPLGIKSDDVCQIMYTSGTEGTPKGVMTTHGGYTDNALIRSTMLELTENDTTLLALPLFHMFAVSTLLNFITVGGSVVLTERFQTKEAMELLHKNRITFFTGVPTMYSYILNHPEIDNYDLSSIRLCIIAGGNVNYDVVEKFEKKFGCLFIESMGQTELSPLVMINPPHRDKRRLGSCGITAYNMETRLVDENDKDVPLGEPGELVVKSPCIMKGYYNLPEANEKAFRNNWFHTGDLLRQDKDGYYYFVDRKKDMIVTSGYNIYAKEIENVLLRHDKVMETAVIGVPDEVKGQLAKALVVKEEGSTLTEEELKTFTRGFLAPYKVPRIIEFVDSLPHTPQGKIAKAKLRMREDQKHS
jgi:long-chain acyl-CoA synthetase